MNTQTTPWWLMRHADHTRDKLNDAGIAQCKTVSNKIGCYSDCYSSLTIVYSDQYNRTKETAELIQSHLKDRFTVTVMSNMEAKLGPFYMIGKTIRDYFEREDTPETTLTIVVGSLNDIPNILDDYRITGRCYEASRMESYMKNTNFLKMERLVLLAQEIGLFNLDRLESHMN